MQFETIANSYLERSYKDRRVFKTVFPSWDNTARTGNRAVVVLNGTPDNYEHWLAATIDLVQQSGDSEQPVFINAWNEWAEGCHLEPDRRYGHGFLQATLNARQGQRRFKAFPHTELPHSTAPAARRFWAEIGDAVRYHGWLRFGNLRLAINRRPWLRSLLLPFVRILRRVRGLFS